MNMENTGFAQEAQLVGLVAHEAVDEPDAIARHPEVVDVVANLAGRDGLNALFGSNGHDPEAFVTALAAGLRPYQEMPLEDPGLVENMALLAVALRGDYNLDHPAAHSA
jgi:hypothetical protein